MIVPLLFKIESVERREAFDASLLGSESDYPTYRVHAVVLDTDTGEVLTYDLHTLVDSSRELGAEIGTVAFSPLEASRQVLANLRDELNGVLGDPAVERVAPERHHRDVRVRVRGYCVDESEDDRGQYVEVEVEPS